MKLHSRQFEKSLRRGVRAAVRSSPELKREFKRVHGPRKQYQGMLIVRPGISLLIGLIAGVIFTETNHARTALAWLTCWTLTMMLYRAQSLPQCLYRDKDLAAFSMLPIDPAAVFRQQTGKFLRTSLYSLADIIAGLAGLGVAANFSGLQWMLVPLTALVAWGTLLGLATLCAARFLKYASIAAVLVTGFWALAILGHNLIPPRVWIRLLDENADRFNLFLPTGWSLAGLQPFLEPGCWFNLLLLFPIGLVWWKAKGILDEARKGYYFAETSREEAPDEWPGDRLPKEDLVAGQRPKHFGDTTIEEAVCTRAFLEVKPWETRGWMERWLWRRLNPREKNLMEAAFPDGPSLTARWKMNFYVLAGFLLAGFTAGLVSPSLEASIIGVGILISFVIALASLGETGQIFQPRFCSGVNVPFYAMQGIGFRELVRMFFKFSAVQLPAVALLSGAGGMAVAHLVGITVTAGLLHGLRAGGLLFAGRLGLMVFSFSGGTNDSVRKNFGTFFLLISIIGFGGLFLILGMIGVLLPNHMAGFALTLASLFFAWAMLRVYGWFYHRNRFDLMNAPSR